ncbi:S53 family peptidase [Jatrophihabitans endophyticus]|uniref:S53 family peptidase n=1 Tax=Jatrophihabitans endophyticus TaxID=1206085 RepID=UPI0026F0AC18|nr:S53 family peptidase [Jatrophihabitans endophyticus]
MQIAHRGLIVLAGSAALLAAGLTAVGTAATAASPAPAGAHHVRTTRLCSTPAKHQLACYAIKQVSPSEPKALSADSAHAVKPNATPSGYGPSDLRSAYNLTASGSSSETVAIVDAYNDPNIASDLSTYRSQYGLPACTTASGCFKVVSQTGSTTSLPANDTGWAGEESLDVDMVSAICPNCHILLVEAKSPTTANLGTAVNEAVALGAKFVSNSYGGSESSSVTTASTKYYDHPGVAITASAGDSDYDGGSFPATSQYVTAVGGTSLSRSSTARGWTEKVWNTTSYSEGTGSGCSRYIAKPSFQANVTTGCSKRAEADVSSDADPATGVAVYETYGASGWEVYGGTSAAAPVIAATYALAGTPSSGSFPNAFPYAHTSSLNDVTSGKNGTCGAPICTAGTGWDGPTGFGTPNGTAAFAG